MSHPQKNLEFWKKSDFVPKCNFACGKCHFFQREISTFSLGNLYKNGHPTTALCITGLVSSWVAQTPAREGILAKQDETIIRIIPRVPPIIPLTFRPWLNRLLEKITET